MIMRTITISDLHGKDVWQNIDPEKYDKIIFLGDYVDAPYKCWNDIHIKDKNFYNLIDSVNGKTNGEILNNLSNLILFKKRYKSKVELLVGNHDIQYILRSRNFNLFSKCRASGYRKSISDNLSLLFNQNFNSFKICFQLGNFLWSHAGITQNTYNLYFKCRFNNDYDIFSREINKLFYSDDPDLYRISFERGGNELYSSILWTDLSEWIHDSEYIFPFNQIIGHNQVPEIQIMKKGNKEIIFTDVLNTTTTFYEREINLLDFK